MNKETCKLVKELFETYDFNYFTLNKEPKTIIEINDALKNNTNSHTGIFEEVQVITECLKKTNCDYSIDINGNIILHCEIGNC